MRILFLTDGITPYVMGGMQKHSYVLSRLLSLHNCKITLVHCGFFNQYDFHEDYSEIFSKEDLVNITPLFIPFISQGKLPGHYVSESKVYSNNIKSHLGINLSNYDLIYAQGFTGWSFLKNTYQIPVVVNLHGLEMYQTAPSIRVKMEHYLLRPFVKKIVAKADYILSFGGQIDSILKENLRIDSSKIIQQSNGIEKHWINEGDITVQKIRTLTFIGRYERRKGIEELTQALSSIDSGYEYQFNFIGPIPSESKIKDQRIKYLGEIKETSEIKRLLDNSDYLISPSYAEGMPTVILEAMARGNAVIATDVGANSKMVTDNGWLIESTAPSISDAILKALKMKDKELIRLKQNSLNAIESKFIWESVILNQLSFFKNITKQ